MRHFPVYTPLGPETAMEKSVVLLIDGCVRLLILYCIRVAGGQHIGSSTYWQSFTILLTWGSEERTCLAFNIQDYL